MSDAYERARELRKVRNDFSQLWQKIVNMKKVLIICSCFKFTFIDYSYKQNFSSNILKVL